MLFSPLPDSGSRISNVLHRIVCVCSMLWIGLQLLSCTFAFCGALDDFRKFHGLGFSDPLLHYLNINSFWGALVWLFCAAAEFLVYSLLCRCRKGSRIGPWVFAALLVLHLGMWIVLGYILREANHLSLSVSLVLCCAYFLRFLLPIFKAPLQS